MFPPSSLNFQEAGTSAVLAVHSRLAEGSSLHLIQGIPSVCLLLRPSNDISVHLSTLSMLRAVWRAGSPSVVQAVKALLDVVLPPPSPDPSQNPRLYPADVVSAAAEVILTLLDLPTVAPRDNDKGELQFGYSTMIISLVSPFLGPQHPAEIQTLAAGAICDYAVTDMNRYGTELWYQCGINR